MTGPKAARDTVRIRVTAGTTLLEADVEDLDPDGAPTARVLVKLVARALGMRSFEVHQNGDVTGCLRRGRGAPQGLVGNWMIVPKKEAA